MLPLTGDKFGSATNTIKHDKSHKRRNYSKLSKFLLIVTYFAINEYRILKSTLQLKHNIN